MIRSLFTIFALATMFSACSTDYLDNDVLAGVQIISNNVRLPAEQDTYICPLRENSGWRIVGKTGDDLTFDAEHGEAGTPVVVRFSTAAEGRRSFEVKHVTGTTEVVGIERTAAGVRTVRMLQFNVWQEGTMVSGGYEAIVNEIARSEADFVTLSEVRNYSGTDFTQRLVDALRDKGLTYYAHRSDDTGILSRHPLEAFEVVYPYESDNGTIHKVVAQVAGCRLAIYTAHLDYTHYACYYPRGYDGVSFGKLPAPVTDTERISAMNLASARDEEIAAFVADAAEERRKGSLVALGGDFNEPSHLDWCYDTKDLYDHNGVVYNWDQSLTLQQAGFVDSYRYLYPSPVTHPGFTYPSDNPDADVSRLSWAPDVDERERIDFVYYYPDVRWEVVNATLVGPSGTIVNGRRTANDSQDIFVTPLDKWPSDHKALLIEFSLEETGDR